MEMLIGLMAKFGVAGWITAGVLAIVRAVESILQLKETPEAKTVLQKVKQILKNFFLDLETYKK